jgi:large subunit ribosomal protein L15
VVNLDAIAQAFEAGAVVTPELLRARGVLRGKMAPVKVLGRGELSQALTIEAHKFSESATQKIAAAGGTATVLDKA